MWKPLLAATLAVGRNTKLLTVGSSILAMNAPMAGGGTVAERGGQRGGKRPVGGDEGSSGSLSCERVSLAVEWMPRRTDTPSGPVWPFKV